MINLATFLKTIRYRGFIIFSNFLIPNRVLYIIRGNIGPPLMEMFEKVLKMFEHFFWDALFSSTNIPTLYSKCAKKFRNSKKERNIRANFWLYQILPEKAFSNIQSNRWDQGLMTYMFQQFKHFSISASRFNRFLLEMLLGILYSSMYI